MLASDGTLHYSHLRQFARSAAHYKHTVEHEREATRAMRVGTCVHQMVLGPRGQGVLVFPDDARRGNAWKAFVQNNPGREIVTQPEWDDAKPVADAVLANAHVQKLLEGAQLEVPLTWSTRRVPCSTGGVDILGKSYLVELKTCNSSEPDAFERHSFSMLYHAQMAWYHEAAHENGYDVGDLYIIAAETDPPYPVTVFRLSPELLIEGQKSIALWMDKYISHRDAGTWPGYAQDVVTLQAPAWAREGDE